MRAPAGTLSGWRMIEFESKGIHDARQFFPERQHLCLHEVDRHDHNQPLPPVGCTNAFLWLQLDVLELHSFTSSCVDHDRGLIFCGRLFSQSLARTRQLRLTLPLRLQ